MNKTKSAIALALLALSLAAGGYAIGRYAQPAKVVTKTEIKEITKEVVKKDVVIIDRETKLPDGTVTRERIEIDKSQYEKDQKKNEVAKTETTSRPNYKASALAGLDFRELKPVYGVEVGARIVGPISAGVWGMTNGTAGVSVSLEF